jgi:hypothetical protein
VNFLIFLVDKVVVKRGAISLESQNREPWVLCGEDTEKWADVLRDLCWMV